MKLIAIALLLITCNLFSQGYIVEQVTGKVKILTGASENWSVVKAGDEIKPNTIVMTGENSSIALRYGDMKFVLKENAAVSASNIKKMTLDELILALAMEDIKKAPHKKNNSRSKSTAVYGTDETIKKETGIVNNNFGSMKLNGAKQLAESGYKKSSIIAAKETYRKYPGTTNLIPYRIYFANILIEEGLYEEAYDDFNSFKDLKMTDKEKSEVQNKMDLLNKKLVNRD